MSIAARWQAWERQRSVNVAGPPGGEDLGYGTTFSPRVELFIDEAWVDITRTSKSEAGVYYRDRITVNRGRSDETSTADPSTCTFTLNNRDGRFSPRNPRSPYYGKIGRNTPVRVSVLQNGVRRYRFHGEISAWPVQWDISGTDVYVPIQASGIKRRMQQGSSPIKSAVYRDITSPSRNNIVAYWPMEDGANSTSAASAIEGHPSMRVTSGSPEFAAYSDWLGSDPLPIVHNAWFHTAVPSYSVTGQTSIRFFLKYNSPIPDASVVLLVFITNGSASGWNLGTGSDGALYLGAWDGNDNNLMFTNIGFGMNTAGLRMVTIELTQDGGDIDWHYKTTDFSNGMGINDSFPTVNGSGTITGKTIGRITTIGAGSYKHSDWDVAIGHFSIANNLHAYDQQRSLTAWNDESPSSRLARLASEEQIPIAVGPEDPDNNTTMGNQHGETLIDLLGSCEATDLGMLYEPRDQFGLTYRNRISLYNQASRLSLDYSAHELADSLNPVYDDQKIRNDITITRQDGSSARQILTTGPMSVNDPPGGVGRYDDSQTLSLGSDDQLPSQAGFRLLLGTVDEARYPQIALNLSHESFQSSQDLMNAALTFDVGDRITIDNPPDWLPPDQIDLIVQGYTEVFDQFEYNMTANCAPGSPYQVAVSDETEMRADTGGSELTSSITSADVSIGVTTTGAYRWIDSATYASDFPFDVVVGGEHMTVTAITGTTTSQTFTVTRSVNGITKAHIAGESVSLATKTNVAL